jgi:hypothetical protein
MSPAPVFGPEVLVFGPSLLGSAAARLSWNAVAGATGYDLLYNQSGTAPSPGEQGTGPYLNLQGESADIEERLDVGQTYHFWVRGTRTVNGITVPGEWSDELVISPKMGTAGINVSFPPENLPKDETFTISGVTDTDLSWVNNTPMTVTVPKTYTSYQWFDGIVPIAGAQSYAITVNARSFALGRHKLSVRVTSASGHVYSKTVEFNVGD